MRAKKHNNIMGSKELERSKDSIEIKCRGCAIGKRAEIWSNFVSSKENGYDNSYLIFEDEPTNEYDPNAIKIVCKGECFGTVGYVGKEYTGKVKEILTQCKAYHIDMKNEKESGAKEINLILKWI